MKKFRLLLSVALFICVGGGGAFAQDLVTVSGTVTSSDTAEPLVGVTIIAGPASGATTLVDGSYSISVAPGSILVFQYLGHLTQQYAVPFGSGKVTYDVRLERDRQVIEDVVVIAYGVRKKGTVAGSVSTVKGEKIENTPTSSFAAALQGMAPGLSVLSNSGAPNATPELHIRGTNSINSGTDPLIILDGIPISIADLNTISPADIESSTVLKDAASTAIYGARAANGVLVVTTKRGRVADAAQITFRTQLGFSQLARSKWNIMNTAERILYEKEVGLTAGKDYEELGKTDTNWLDEVFSRSAMVQNYELQVSGASERFNYYVSGGYYSQDGLTRDSDFDRYNFRVNMETQANKWLKLGTNTMLAYEKYSETVSGSYYTNTPVPAVRFMLPYISPYKKDGSLASVNDGSWMGTGENPLEWADNNPYIGKKYKVISSLYAEVSPVRGLTIRSQGGLDYTHSAGLTKSYPSYRPNNGEGSVARSSTDAINLTITNTINYQFDVKDVHNFNFMVGQEGISYNAEGFSVSAAGQNNDLLTNLSTGTRSTSWSDSSASYSYLSFFGRGEYNYRNRYYADFSVRGDGSSRFGTNGRWAAFWAGSFMWSAHNEKFLQNVKWLTNAQLVVSAGTSGNSSIPNYDHLALVSGGIDYLDTAGIAPSSKGNENLKWEKVFATNVALRLGFWNRLDFEVEFYNKVTSNMLMAVPVSYTDAGYGFRWDNVGRMVNRGVELNLNADVIRNKNFVWNLSANVSYNHNEILELYNGVDEYVVGMSSTKHVVGHSSGEFFMNRYAGVNPANGDALWYDKDGNITTEFRESDQVMLGKTAIAPWQGGFGTSVSWKGLTLSAQFNWVAERWMVNNDRYFEESNGLFDSYNQSKRMLYDRWKKPGDVTDIPRYGVSPQFDSRLLEDASFLRLKNLMLSYSFPRDLLARTKFLAGTRVYAQATNLLTFTGFSGLDPESTSNVYQAQYPMTRQFTFGLELTF